MYGVKMMMIIIRIQKQPKERCKEKFEDAFSSLDLLVLDVSVQMLLLVHSWAVRRWRPGV